MNEKTRIDIHEILIFSLLIVLSYLIIATHVTAPKDREDILEDGFKSHAGIIQYQKGTRSAIGSGSGIIYDGSGHILTMAHVVIPANRPITDIRTIHEVADIVVTLANGKEYPARIALIEKPEIGVLKVDIPEEDWRDLFVARLWNPRMSSQKKLSKGNEVCAIGEPLFRPSSSCGTISGTGYILGSDIPGLYGLKETRLIQTDTAINPGNSGGGLYLVRTGEVIALMVVKNFKKEGISFGVPIATILQVLQEKGWKR